MKRLGCFWLAILLLLSLVACSGSKAETSAEDLPTWQEQYNLGIRYLADGNYEEAIIAFTAAIEIDPKQPEAYIGLAEVYTAQGDLEKAAAILDEALTAAGESETLSAARERLLENSSGVPVLPEILTDEAVYRNHSCKYQAEYYVEPTAELKTAFAPIIAAGLADDQAKVRELLVSETLWNAAVAVSGEWGSEGVQPRSLFWTKIDDAVLYYGAYMSKDLGEAPTMITLEYREESGNIFYCDDMQSAQNQNPPSWSYAYGSAENYLWNGSFTKYHTVQGDYGRETVSYGNAKDELLHGECIEETTGEYSGEQGVHYETFEQFENGKRLFCWTDEDGKPATTKRVVNGETDYYVAYGGNPPYAFECVTRLW